MPKAARRFGQVPDSRGPIGGCCMNLGMLQFPSEVWLKNNSQIFVLLNWTGGTGGDGTIGISSIEDQVTWHDITARSRKVH